MSETDPRLSSDDAPRGRSRKITAEQLYPLLVVLLLAGLAAALYAAYETVNPAASAVCSTSGYISCSKVGGSGHTTIAGIPDWAIGVGGYLGMTALGILAFRTFERRYLTLLAGLSAVGLLLSLYFVYEEVVVIQALCPVCSTAHALNVAVLAVTVALLRMSRPEA
jgi:uncharacterized membrane protein